MSVITKNVIMQNVIKLSVVAQARQLTRQSLKFSYPFCNFKLDHSANKEEKWTILKHACI